jgi:hypothetical protein
MTKSNLITLMGVVKPGHKVASGQAVDSPYAQGTLEMQLPFFRALGLDLSSFYLGTINVSLAPYTFELLHPQYTFPLVKWHPDYPAETFSFASCVVTHQNINYEGLVYYPHPETKIGHFQDASIVEIMTPRIPQLNYGDRLILKLDRQKIRLTIDEEK